MDPIPRERMGNATSLFNLMRNLGGSIGIAIDRHACWRASSRRTSTSSARTSTPIRRRRSTAFECARQGFIARGADSGTATQRAYAALFGIGAAAGGDGVVRRRCSGCSAMIFLLLLPLVLLMRRPRAAAGGCGH